MIVTWNTPITFIGYIDENIFHWSGYRHLPDWIENWCCGWYLLKGIHRHLIVGHGSMARYNMSIALFELGGTWIDGMSLDQSELDLLDAQFGKERWFAITLPPE